MSRNLEERIEKISAILENLKDESSRGTAIIVEGKKDISTLRKLQITGPAIPAKGSGRNILDVVNEIEKKGIKEVILLLDFDRRGRQLTSRLIENLEAVRIKPNLVYWKKLSRFVGRDLAEIEGLANYLQTLNKKLGKNILDDVE